MERKNLSLSSTQCRLLDEIIKSIGGKYKLDYMICFGCTSDTKAMSSCFTSDNNHSDTQYFLLMVTTGNPHVEHEVQEYVGRFLDKAKITIIVHSLEAVTNAVKQGDRFFTAVCRYGMQLYSADGLRLNLEYIDLNPATTFSQAQKYYYDRFGMALGFFEAANTCYENGFYTNCLFLLNRAVEQACKVTIKVYMAYLPEMHNVSRLLNFCRCFSDEPSYVLSRISEEDKRLFQLLFNGYTDALYRDEHKISEIDADKLCTRVWEFLTAIKKLCNNRLNEYRQEAEEAGKAIEQHVPLLPSSLFV
jgi:HEPN domain-containing protein